MKRAVWRTRYSKLYRAHYHRRGKYGPLFRPYGRHSWYYRK